MSAVLASPARTAPMAVAAIRALISNHKAHFCLFGPLPATKVAAAISAQIHALTLEVPSRMARLSIVAGIGAARPAEMRLPYSVDYICWLEDRGRMVDLVSGEVVYARLVATPTASAKAVAYLLAGVEGEVVVT